MTRKVQGTGPLTRFARDEGGALTIFGLFVMVIILVAGGLAVDTMRHERERARLQASLDRGVLAAAAIEQPLVPADVVQDYFDVAGLPDALGEVTADTGLNFKDVCADASRTMPTLLLDLVGVETLIAAVEACAEERVGDIEISLVLDISGSMRNGQRIKRLRVAAGDFVDSVLEGARAERTTVSVVPYAGQVNPGPAVFDMIGGVRAHTASSCTVLDARDFDGTGLPVHSTEQVPHFMVWPIDRPTMDFGWCPSDASSIRYFSNDAAALRSFIDGMRLHDGTGTQVGMKYGLALLDPASNGAARALNAAGLASDLASDRPLAWNAPDLRKYIVLMTDGGITAQFEPRRTGFVDYDEDADDNEKATPTTPTASITPRSTRGSSSSCRRSRSSRERPRGRSSTERARTRRCGRPPSAARPASTKGTSGRFAPWPRRRASSSTPSPSTCPPPRPAARCAAAPPRRPTSTT